MDRDSAPPGSDEQRLLAVILDPANNADGFGAARLLDAADRFDPLRVDHWAGVAGMMVVAAARDGNAFGVNRVSPATPGGPAGLQVTVWVPALGVTVGELVDELALAGCGTGRHGAACCAALLERAWRRLVHRLDRAIPTWRAHPA